MASADGFYGYLGQKLVLASSFDPLPASPILGKWKLVTTVGLGMMSFFTA
jgi:hypothetical protein